MFEIPHPRPYRNSRRAKSEGIYMNPRRNAVIQNAAEAAARVGPQLILSLKQSYRWYFNTMLPFINM